MGLAIFFPAQDREAVRHETLAPCEIIGTRTRSFIPIRVPPAVDDLRARALELPGEVGPGSERLLIDEARALRSIRVGIPGARLAALPVVADQDRRDVRVEIQDGRKTVAVGHDDGVAF